MKAGFCLECAYLEYAKDYYYRRKDAGSRQSWEYLGFVCFCSPSQPWFELISIEGKNRYEADKLVSLKPKDITEDRIGKLYRHDAMS